MGLLTVDRGGVQKDAMKTAKWWLPWLAVTVVALGFANFLAFFVESLALGGDALNGRMIDGHYFIASHGTYTEVTQAVWTLSRIHAIATFVSWPFVLISMAFLVFRYAFPFAMAGRASGNADARVRAVRASGEPIWSGWPGGIAGGLFASIGMLQAAVYPGGIVARVRFMSPFATPVEEIKSVRFGRRRLWPTIEIEHQGVDVASPLVLYGGRTSPQAAAVSALVTDTPRTGDAPESPVTDSEAAHHPMDAWARAASERANPPGPVRAASLFGLLVGAVIIAIGVLWAVPTLGPFGIFWTGGAVIILVVNVRRFVLRGW